MSSSRLLPLVYNVSTFGGVTRDYQSLAVWEAATDIDLVAANSGEVLDCYADAVSYNQTINMIGATTNSNYFRVLRAASGQEHNGLPSTGFRLEFSGTLRTIRLGENFSSAYDVDVSMTGTGNMSAIEISIGDNCRVVGCIAKAVVATARGLGINTISAGKTYYIINNLCYENDDDGLRIDDGTGYFYNNTLVDNGGYGFNAVAGTAHLKNCIAQGNSSGQINGALASNITNVTSGVAFQDASADNYLLALGDTAAKDQGTDLSTDANFPFDDDVLRNTRGAPWDVGMHEIQAAGPVGPFAPVFNSLFSDVFTDIYGR